MKKLLVLLTASASLLTAQTAFANMYGVSWLNGWYIQGSGSVAWHNSQKFNGSFSDESFTADISNHVGFKTGYGAAASVGAILCQQWRLEAEVLWRRAKIDSISLNINSQPAGAAFVGSQNLGGARGHVQDIAFMLNAYYDIPLWCYWGAYIGAGIGVDFNELKNSGTITFTDGSTSSANGKKHTTLFAWQVSGGLNYDITDCLTFFAGYRLFMTTKEKINFNSGVDTSGSQEQLDFGFKAHEIPLVHSVDIGLRWRL